MVRCIPALVVVLVLCLSIFGQPSDISPSPVEVKYRGTAVEWTPLVPAAGCRLSVAGPDRLYFEQEFRSGAQPVFSTRDEQGLARPEGSYRWELIVELPASGSGAANPIVSGEFAIRAGQIIPLPKNQAPAVVDPAAPAGTLVLDGEGRLGLGTTVPASQLHLKGPEPAFTLEDTTTGGRAYTLRSLEKGDGSLGLFDQAGETPRWLVDSEGRVGINTAKPTATLTVDGYVEATKGFLVNGRPVGGIGLGAFLGGAQPLYTESVGNNFFGTNAGASNPTGSYNSFFGAYAGRSDTTGNSNSFFGFSAGYSNTSGYWNSFFGRYAGWYNSTGYLNSFLGGYAGYQNTTGYYNSFLGGYAGYENTTGNENSFFGVNAGYSNGTGSLNSFFGENAGYQSTTGYWNSFFGAYAGDSNTVEAANTFIGYASDLDPGQSPDANPVRNATAIGYRAYVSRSNSLVLGSIAGVNNASSSVNVGIGTPSPERQLHLKGDNAVFRMDRSSDTAAFIMVRTDSGGNPLKTFVVGTNASGPNQGEFIINDIGAAVGGAGNRRMTITNEGAVQFTGTVSAVDFIQASSLAFKTNVRTYENALETVNRLRGVRFDWKDSGKAAVGLIAEEVEKVVPEVVAHDGSGGAASGVNYASLVAVLVEAVKDQQKTIKEQEQAIRAQQRTNEEQRAALQKELADVKAEVETLRALLRR